jgi:hypothetical protein
MATHTVNVDAYGYTGMLSAKLRDPDTITTLVSTGTAVASGTIASRIVCTFTETPAIAAGDYLLELIVNGVSYILYVTLTGVSGESALARSERVTSDATLANQLLILEQLDDLAAVQLAAVEVDAGTISGFPETLIIGDSYSEDTGQIRINILDSTTEDPIDSLGSLEFADADVYFTAFRPNDSARIVGSCEYVRVPSSGTLEESYVLVTLLTSETSKGKAEYTYEGRLKFVWQGPSSSDETDEEQKTYKTTPFKFISNP